MKAQDGGAPRRAGLLLAAGTFLLLRLLPVPEGLSAAGWAVAAVGSAMAILWFTEAIPISVTAALPFLLLPAMGVGTPADIAASYWSPILFLVLGGAMVARAVEKTGLHRRVALAVVKRAPGTRFGLLLGFMAATAVISMIVSNTASALIMLPVALALLAAVEPTLPEARRQGFGKALVLGVAWAATLGGLGTLVGSPTNAIAAGIINRAMDVEIDFLTWLGFGLPVVLIALPVTALVLTGLHRVSGARLDRELVAAAIGEAGPLSVPERRLLPLIVLLLAGWVSLPLLREPLGLPPVDDGTLAMAAGLLLFALPTGRTPGERFLEPEDLPSLPWPILLLFGGGLALAGAITDSGLAAYIGEQLEGLQAVHPMLLAMLLVLLIVMVTEFASNVATASGFIPVVAAVAAGGAAPPLALAMPAALASSWGFMMPAGTPPNAIAFSSGRLRVADMVKGGFVINLIGVPLLVLVCFAIAG
ncbi:MAG: DASS family sodium-coupled anion symporter [Sphingomonadaceae bacterium]